MSQSDYTGGQPVPESEDEAAERAKAQQEEDAPRPGEPGYEEDADDDERP